MSCVRKIELEENSAEELMAKRARYYALPPKIHNDPFQTEADNLTMAGADKMDNLVNEEERKRLNAGKVIKPIFDDMEFAKRLELLRKHMQEENLDVVILTSFHNIKYFTNFLYCKFGRNYASVITKDAISLFTAGIDSLAPRRNVTGGVKNYTYTDWNKDNFLEAVKQEMPSSNGSLVRIGYEADDMNMKLREQIRSYCYSTNDNGLKETTEFADVSADLMKHRLIKSPKEIEVIRKAAEVANFGADALIANLQTGRKEYDIAQCAVKTMCEKIDEAYPQTEMMNTWCWFQSGINTDGAHNALTCKPLAEEDLLSFNLFPMIDGYYVANERTAYFGKNISEAHLKYWNINVEVFEAGKKLIKPGVVVKDIAKALNQIYHKHNVLQYRTFGYGHSFGVLCHYYGRETILEIREDNETILEENMVVSMEPMITIPEYMEGAGGYREHDILLVTKSGNENLTNYKYGPEQMIFS